MKIKSAKSFRTWFKNKDKARQEAAAYWDENFMGSQQGDKSGFFKMFHGEKEKIYDFLRKEVEMAEDGQAIYEFVQNAADSESTQFYMFFNENYLVAINNGKVFNAKGIQSILNIGQSFDKDDDLDKIGRYGIGFKLVHRLVGKSSGLDELLNTDGQGYRGPVLFSWNKKEHFDEFLKFEQFEYDNIENQDIPWLLKILITNFPAQPNETVKDVEFADITPFSLEEVKNYQAFLNSVLDKIDTDAMSQGSMFFIKLGEGKYDYLDKQKQNYLGGLSTSMHFLKSLQLIQINEAKIKKDHNATNLLEFVINKDTDDYDTVGLTEKRDKSSDIKFKICYADNAKSAVELKQHPNIYKFFPAVKEVNNLSFVIHSNVFALSSNRQNLSETTPLNRELLKLLSKCISEKMTSLKATDKDIFKKLFISILMSDAPTSTAGNGWQKEFFFDKLLQYIKTNVPTENGFTDSSANVKINKSKLNLNLADFGLGHIQWFEWKDSKDQILLDEAQKKEKLGIEKWDICDIVENADLNSINNWIENADERDYKSFLKELEEVGSYYRQATKARINEICLYKCSDGNFYSANELSQYVIFHTNKTVQIKSELEELGFITSELDISEYENIFSVVKNKMPTDKKLFEYIANRCEDNSLEAKQKQNLFLNFINEDTKFEGVAEQTLLKLCLFCNVNNEIVPLSSLISSQLETPEWLDNFKISDEEYFDELDDYFIQEKSFYQEIILPNWDDMISEIDESKVEYFYEKIVEYYGLGDSNTPFKKQNFIFISDNEGFVSRDSDVFFNSKMLELKTKYDDFQTAVEALFETQTPYKSIAKFLSDEPFKLDDSDLFDWSISEADVSVDEVKALLKFCELNNEHFFEHCIIEKNGDNFTIYETSDDKFQIIPPDRQAKNFIEGNCSDSLIVLPIEFSDYNNQSGIVKRQELHSKIIECVDVDDFKEELVDIVKYDAKLQFLKKLSEFRFDAETKYSKENYEYKLLASACDAIKATDNNWFRKKVVIEIEREKLSLSEIPSCDDNVKFGDKELSLSKILPNQYQNSNVLSDLLNQFITMGLPKEKLYAFFDIQSEADPEQIFELLSNKYSVLENAQQLAFLLLYDKEIEEVNFDQFKVETLDDESWELEYSYYTQAFAFIGDDYLLKPQYADITKIMSLPETIGNSDNKILTKPYFGDDSFICPSLKSELSEEEKLALIDFLFSEWGKKTNKAKIKNIDWSKINDTDSEKLLDFNPSTCVYPSEYACENEVLPEYLIDWLNEKEDKKQFLSDIGVWVEDTSTSVVTDLRKFLKSDSDNFNKSRLSQTTCFNDDETMLFNTFEWLKENEIELTTAEQFDVFKKVVEVINDNRKNGDLVILENFDFEKLEENSTRWEKTRNFTIYQYDGQMPTTVALNEIDDYIFYRYNADDYAIKDSYIYINSQSDSQKILRKVEADEENDFNSDDLSEIFEDELNRSRKKVESLEKQISTRDDAADIDLGGWSNDVPSQQQKDWNLEAQKIVKEELKKKGYIFTQGIGEYGIIKGVKKDGVEYPLVVLSCKGGKLFINPNQWLQLCEPNALLLGVGQEREIRSFALKQLLGISQEFNLRFKIDKMEDRNYSEFAEIFHYFSGVNMQIPIDNTMGTTERLVAFFPPAKTETDIKDNENDL